MDASFLSKLNLLLNEVSAGKTANKFAEYRAGSWIRNEHDTMPRGRVRFLTEVAEQLPSHPSRGHLYRLMRFAETVPQFLIEQGRPPQEPRKVTREEFQAGNCDVLAIRNDSNSAPAESPRNGNSVEPQRKPGRPRKELGKLANPAPTAPANGEIHWCDPGLTKLATDMSEAVQLGVRYSAIYTGSLLDLAVAEDERDTSDRLGTLRGLPFPQFAADNAHLHVWGRASQIFLIQELLAEWGFQCAGFLVLSSSSPQRIATSPFCSAFSICVNAKRGNLPFTRTERPDLVASNFGEDWDSPTLKRQLQMVSPAGLIQLLPHSSPASWQRID